MTGRVVLEVGRFDSHCGACGKPCDPASKSHDVLLGYGAENGSLGCGATWTHTLAVYGDERAIAATVRLRPDLPCLNLSSSVWEVQQ